YFPNSTSVQGINHSWQIGAVIGKFYIALHRYCVFRTAAVNESVWSPTLVRVLIVIQFVVPLLITGGCFSVGYNVQRTVDGAISFTIAAEGQIGSFFHRNMFIIVAVCCFSHNLKAAQQSLVVIFSLNGTIDRFWYETLLWPTFVATNGLATYAPPLILIFCSRRVRVCLFGGTCDLG
ncbi:hypothetical protein PENTCL1PPCAC_14630, partial [Pristionchus entomophagus]